MAGQYHGDSPLLSAIVPLLQSGSALFAGSADEFISMAPASKLTAHLTREFNRRWGTATESEIRSWRASLTALAAVADACDVDRSAVGVEVKLPLTDKRVDVSFVGRSRTSAPQVVLVELKQWDAAGPSLYPENVVVGGRELLHPSAQVAAYAQYLRDSHSAFTEDGFHLSACAYLHNMSRAAAAPLTGPDYQAILAEAPLFSGGDGVALSAYLEERLAGGGGTDLLERVVSGRYRPSRQLIASIAKALESSPQWTLLDEQRVAFNIVRGAVERAARSGEKRTIIVMGAPGTGKSVIAANLLVEMARGGHAVAHATGSKAFTTSLRALGPRSSSAVFRYFNNFMHKQVQEDALDLLIADEAHRIRETSNDRFTKAALRSEVSQAEELVRAAKVSVFLLDERQNVRPGEIGSPQEIRRAATARGVPIEEISLEGQFRCNSGGYVEWVDALLSPRPVRPGPWFASGEYELELFDDPAAMEHEVFRRARAGDSARMVAGFCWPWSDPLPRGGLAPDVRIGSWSRPWNEKSPEQQRPPRPAPPPQRHPYYLWATQPDRVREIGCIYSAQGFEFDYCGVILGDDLVWRNDRWRSRKEESCDSAVTRRRLEGDELTALLQHTYRVLLTRGIKGTFVHSTDPETREFLRALVARGSD